MNQEIALILFEFAVLVFAFSIHEAAHAWMASRLGDQTARMLGRVTLNPLKHIDPLGSVIMPLIAAFYHFPMIGWAKPTPVTARNFKNYKRDDILVTIAGPLSNLITAFVCVFLLVVVKHVVHGGWDAILNAAALAQRSPAASLAGQSVLFPIVLLLYIGILLNLLLFAFNLLPIPPLDGSRVLTHFLSPRLADLYNRMGMFSLIIIFLVGGRLIGVVYYPLLGIFNGMLDAL
jgi:Zn-dependent protease